MAGRINPKTGVRPSASGKSWTTPVSKKDDKKVEDLNKKIKQLEKEESDLITQIQVLEKQKETAKKNNDTAEAARIQTLITTKRSDLTKKSAELNTARTEQQRIIYGIKPLGNIAMSVDSSTTPAKGSSNTDGPIVTPPESPSPKLQWKYNPPMVKAAYLTPTGLQRQDGSLAVDNPGSWSDAMDAWTTTAGSKGVIQMSRKYPFEAYSWITGKRGVSVQEDTTIYGFKFLYNPTTVQMSWGVSTEIDPVKLATGQLTANPITDAALNSSITFSLILNRMLDMNIVRRNGTLLGDYYPYPLSIEDSTGIYERGTMHDLEYLFRAVNGVNVDYSPPLQRYLNLKTADLGWLQSFPVELHLGNSLRYLVRVTSINVEHKIFNEKMIPIFSQVDLVCKRLPDVPSDEQQQGGGGVGPAQML